MTERCPACGYEDTRNAFECFISAVDQKGPPRFGVICPKCETDLEGLRTSPTHAAPEPSATQGDSA